MWRYEFDDHGGYDATSAAFVIYAPDGHRALEIDVQDHVTIDEVQAAPNGAWDLHHSRHPKAEALARAICARLNA